ncbi:MAG: type II toxin-antitoxin system HicB family antitoxin [Thermomicrobiales bacterium]
MRSEHRYHPIYTRRVVISDEARRRAALPYSIAIAYDDENGYVAQAEEFPWLVAAEETPEAAESSLRHAIALVIANAMRHDRTVPEPQRVTA